jgi:putative RNA 2'-phosphotransferase
MDRENQMAEDLQRTSKFLSLVLRHKPEVIGICLDEHGWVEVAVLIEAAGRHGRPLTRALVEQVVRTSDKQRFALSADGLRLRANQGHSVPVDLQLSPSVPPEVLYHGTATRFVASIKVEGLRPGSRQQVHLSATTATALNVGQRHGKPIVLTVRARALHEAGQRFYLAENGVWLTDAVAPQYLQIPEFPS